MALIKGTMLSDIRGSINGSTYARNRYGAYARNRTVPVNPNSSSQVDIRAALTGGTENWRNLTGAQRLSWKLYADGTPQTNKLGDVIYLSGQAMYVKHFTFATYHGISVPTNPPAEPGSSAQISLADIILASSASTAPNSIEATWTGGATTASDFYAIFISPPVSVGRSFFKGPWQGSTAAAGTALSGPITLPVVLTVGQTRWVKILYRNAAGKLGPASIFGPITVTTVV